MELQKEEPYEKTELQKIYDCLTKSQAEERRLRYDLFEARSNLSYVSKHEKMAFGELLTQMFFFIPVSLEIGFEIITIMERCGMGCAMQLLKSSFILLYLIPIWFVISKRMYGILVKMTGLPSLFYIKTLTFQEEILFLNDKIKRSQKKLEDTLNELKQLNIEKEKLEEASLEEEKKKREQQMREVFSNHTRLNIVSHCYTEEIFLKQKQRCRENLKFYEMCMEEKEEEKEDLLRELKMIKKEFQTAKTQIIIFITAYLVLVCAWKVMIKNEEIASVFIMLGMTVILLFLIYYFQVLDKKITDYLVEQESIFTMGYAFSNNLVPRKYEIIRIDTELNWMKEKMQTIRNELEELISSEG